MTEVAGPKNEGNRNKVFCLSFLDLVFLQILDHVPEKIVFANSVFDPDLEFFHFCFNHPWKLTYLYQKFNFIAISRWFHPITYKIA